MYKRQELALFCTADALLAGLLGLHNDSGHAVRLVMDRDVYTAPYFA